MLKLTMKPTAKGAAADNRPTGDIHKKAQVLTSREKPSRRRTRDSDLLSSTSSPETSKRRRASLDHLTSKQKTLDDIILQATLPNLLAHHVPQCLHNCCFSIPGLKMTTTDTTSPYARGSRYEVEVHDNETVPPEIFEDCFRLIELTSADTYRRSSIGWSVPDKKKQMAEEGMRSLVLVRRGLQCDEKAENSLNSKRQTHAEGGQFPRVGGFLHFMATEEEELPVLYIYEIHLHPMLQGRSVGAHLLSFAESIGSSLKLSKMMLTVFRRNEGAMRFYRKHGFQEDEISPRPRKLRSGKIKEWDYMIMSKELLPDNGEERSLQTST